jgi:SAM-dependent methyltransferase
MKARQGSEKYDVWKDGAPMTNAQDNAPTPDSQMARIFEWRAGFNGLHLLDIGVRLGLFRALADSPGVQAEELADRLGLQRQHVRVWCQTAYGMEVLDADEAGGFRLAPYYDQILANPSHPRYLGAYLRLGTEVGAEDFRSAPELYRTGGTVPFQGRGAHFAETVAESTKGLQVMVMKMLLPEVAGLADTLQAGGSVLEVGCGAGTLLIALARQFPQARFTGVEIDPDGAAAAQVRIRDAGVADRVTVRQGAVQDAVAPGTFDLCLMVQVLHEIAADIRPDVVKAAAGALKPGGWMVILDETYPSTLAEMRDPAFHTSLQTAFFELTWGNVIPTREEQEKLLRDAGFKGPIGRKLVNNSFTVLTAQA